MIVRCTECHSDVTDEQGFHRCSGPGRRHPRPELHAADEHGLAVVLQHPYRPVALAVLPQPARVEAAVCQWCRWSMSPHHGALVCLHPLHRDTGEANRAFDCHGTGGLNPRGECPHFSPSWWTRLGRVLRLWRAPAMVDPRVWEPKP